VKIVRISNFNSNKLINESIAENVQTFYGEKIVEFLNKTFSGDYATDYFRLVKDDTKLYKFIP